MRYARRTARSHLYVESRKVELREAERRAVVSGARRVAEGGSQRGDFQFEVNAFGDLRSSEGTTLTGLHCVFESF